MNTESTPQVMVAILCIALGACAPLPQSAFESPQVRLSGVECTGLGFNAQTFVLSFDVTNPNSFDLPVTAVAYGLHLEGRRFASGETSGQFTVPAHGNREYAISVDLDLLSTSPQLLAAIRDGVRNSVRYELKGRFVVDLPDSTVIKYRNAGQVELGGSATSFFQP